MSTPRTTASYLRVSTADQSVEAQRNEIAAYVAARGLGAVREFTDVMSGSRRERPGLDALMALVRSGAIETVLCVKLDRMARSLTHFASIMAEFEKHGVALICTSQGIDTSKTNACGRLQMAVLSAVAEFERELNRERTRAGLEVARARGKKLGRPSPRMHGLDRAAIVRQWRADGKPGALRGLGRRLGGVGASTASRVALAVA